MATGKSSLERLFDEIVKSSVTAVLKPCGFRKSALNFHRRHRELVQVVNLQSSAGSSWDNKMFYINVGVAFDDVCRLTKIEILEKPKEYDCDERGMRARLETLIEKNPARWSVSENGDAELLAKQLQMAMEHLSAELDAFHSVQTYREHPWFDRFRPTGVRAQMLYLLGDLDGARDEVEQLCVLFADRRRGKEPQAWIDELGLFNLRMDTF